jgi:hypothetical protein
MTNNGSNYSSGHTEAAQHQGNAEPGGGATVVDQDNGTVLVVAGGGGGSLTGGNGNPWPGGREALFLVAGQVSSRTAGPAAGPAGAGSAGCAADCDDRGAAPR